MPLSTRLQRAWTLCIEVQDKQKQLAEELRGTNLYDFAASQVNDTQAIETLILKSRDKEPSAASAGAAR